MFVEYERQSEKVNLFTSHMSRQIEREREARQGKANTRQARRDVDTTAGLFPVSFASFTALLPLHHSLAAPSSRRSRFGRPRAREHEK